MTFEEWLQSYGQHFEPTSLARAAWGAGYWEGFGDGFYDAQKALNTPTSDEQGGGNTHGA